MAFQKETLISLDGTDFAASPSSLADLLSKLRSQKYETLNLYKSKFSEEQALTFFTDVSALSSLKRLSLNGVLVSGKALAQLSATLSNETMPLISLSLSRCDLSFEDVPSLLSILYSKTTTLSRLDLSGNVKLGTTGCAKVCRAAFRLKDFNVSDTNCEDAACLSDLITHARYLERLTCRNNALADPGACALASALLARPGTGSGLKFLDLQGCQIGQVGGSQLILAVTSLKKPITVFLAGNPLSVPCLVDALSKCPSRVCFGDRFDLKKASKTKKRTKAEAVRYVWRQLTRAVRLAETSGSKDTATRKEVLSWFSIKHDAELEGTSAEEEEQEEEEEADHVLGVYGVCLEAYRGNPSTLPTPSSAKKPPASAQKPGKSTPPIPPSSTGKPGSAAPGSAALRRHGTSSEYPGNFALSAYQTTPAPESLPRPSAELLARALTSSLPSLRSWVPKTVPIITEETMQHQQLNDAASLLMQSLSISASSGAESFAWSGLRVHLAYAFTECSPDSPLFAWVHELIRLLSSVGCAVTTCETHGPTGLDTAAVVLFVCLSPRSYEGQHSVAQQLHHARAAGKRFTLLVFDPSFQPTPEMLQAHPACGAALCFVAQRTKEDVERAILENVERVACAPA